LLPNALKNIQFNKVDTVISRYFIGTEIFGIILILKWLFEYNYCAKLLKL
jgi:hypothetical protein